MSDINLARRSFLKSGAAVAATLMASAAANAGIPAAKVQKWDEEYDVVIIGSGFAGMACALKAGRAGLKVLILEKMPVVGGNSAICGGNVACPVNPVQAAQGIKDSKELFIADCLKDGLGINHTELLATIADRCNDTIKMVVDCGCEFVPNKMLFEAGHSVPRSYEIKAGTGSGYIRPMEAELKKIPTVTIRTRCKMDDFVVDETGAVVGITVHDLSSGGLRASISTGRGRADYVATRMILALLLSVVLTAWAVLLGLILLLAPGAQLGGMPLGELVLRALASVLVGWTYAAFGLLLLWLSRRSRGFGTTLLISIMLAGGLLNLALLIPMAVAVPFSQELAYDLAQLLMPLQPAALLGASAELDPGPAMMCVAFIAAFWAISHRLMKRVSL